MKRSRMERILNNTTERDLPHIFIPSYNRPDFVTGKVILPNFTDEALKRVYIVVREEQYKQYKRENRSLIKRGMNMVFIPQGEVSGVGSTRQFIMDYAIENRLPCIMDMDDDIKYLQFLYSGRTSSGEKCSKHTGIKDWKIDPLIPQKVLQLTGKIAREVFRKHPEVLLGNIRKQRFSHHSENSNIRYQINKGPTPRQTKILNMKGIKRAGIRMPDAFNLHGDDIGFAAEVLQNGYSCFNIPCLCYDYVDEKNNSVVRDPHNPDKNRHLHKLEYDGLMQMEIKDYLRESFKFPDGQYMFGDIDWRAYHKLHGTRYYIKHWKTKRK